MAGRKGSRGFIRALAAATALASGCAAAELERIEDHGIAQAPVPSVPHVRATWLGTAGVLLDDGTTAIAIDPFVSRPGLGRVGFGRPIEVDQARVDEWMKAPGMDRVAAIAISQSHYDHVMDAPAFAQRTGATLIGSASTAAIGAAEGLPPNQIMVAQYREPMRFGAFTVTLLESEHAYRGRGVTWEGDIPDGITLPAKAKDYKMGGAYGIVVTHDHAGTVVHHGSAAWVDGMYDGVEADVVILGLALHTDAPGYVRAIADATGARRVIPSHWDNFFRGFDKPLAPLRSARVRSFFDDLADTRPDISVETLPLGRWRVLLAADPR